MALIEIAVLARDIARGRPRRPDCCPLARAANRCGIDAHVFDGAIVLRYQNALGWHRAAVQLPQKAREWLARYDAGQPMEPIRFDIDIPDDYPLGAA